MASRAPGRNDPCPCGSGRKFKQCCLKAWGIEDAARMRLRHLEERVGEQVMAFISRTWSPALAQHAWEDFWNYEDVPEELDDEPEFESMFLPWFAFGFVPDPESEEADPSWPDRPLALEWLDRDGANSAGEERRFVETACRSPWSVFVIEDAIPGRAFDVRDLLTGRRVRVLEQGGPRNIDPGCLLFARVLTLDEASVFLGVSPYVLPPTWHTHVLDWRARCVGDRLMTPEEVLDYEIELRDLYLDVRAELLDPTPPQLTNTDGDPLAPTKITYELKTGVAQAFENLRPLGVLDGEDHHEVSRDGSGAVTAATIGWMGEGRAGLENVSLGELTLSPGRLEVEVNSAARALRIQQEIAHRLGDGALLRDIDTLDVAEMLEEAAASPSAPYETPPELRDLQDRMLAESWAKWLDEAVPALGGRTPREAATTDAGRERLAALLDEFDWRAARGEPGTAKHVARLRQELGLPAPSRGAPRVG